MPVPIWRSRFIKIKQIYLNAKKFYFSAQNIFGNNWTWNYLHKKSQICKTVLLKQITDLEICKTLLHCSKKYVGGYKVPVSYFHLTSFVHVISLLRRNYVRCLNFNFLSLELFERYALVAQIFSKYFSYIQSKAKVKIHRCTFSSLFFVSFLQYFLGYVMPIMYVNFF